MATIPSTEVINSWSNPATGYIASTDTLDTFRKKTNGLAVAVASLANVQAISIKTSGYTITNADKIIICNSGTPFTVVLPAAVSNTGVDFVVKNKGAGVITIDASTAGLIEGASTTTLPQYSSIRVISDGTTWNVI